MKTAWILVTCAALAASPAFADKKLDDAVAKANQLIEKQRPDEALKVIAKISAQDPASIEVQLVLGSFQERLGFLAEAGATLENAVKLSVGATGAARADALAASAAFKLQRGSSVAALAQAHEAVKAHGTALALATLARAQARTGHVADALATSEKAVAAHSTSAIAHEARGEVLLAAGRAADAAVAFNKAAELDPKRWQTRVMIAKALLAEGKAVEAAAEARKVTEADQKNAEAFATLGLALPSKSPADWAEAIGQAQEGARLDPTNPYVQWVVGQLFERNDDYDQSSKAYRQALDTDPDYAPAQLALVKALVRLGNNDGALAEAKKVAERLPENGEAQFLYAEILLRKKEYADALKPAEMAAKLLPKNADAQYYAGIAFQYSGRRADAVAAFGRAADLDPNNTDYLTNYGLLLGMTGNAAAAVQQLEKVVAKPGYKNAAAYANLGKVYLNLEQKETDKSIAAYTKALTFAASAEKSQILLGLGMAYFYAKNYDQAIAAFQQAEGADASLASETLPFIASSYYFRDKEKKDMTQARAALDKAKAKLGAEVPRLIKLEANITRIEKGDVKKPDDEDEVDFGQLIRWANSQSPAMRIKAAKEFAGQGREGAQWLAYLLNDRALDVREQVLVSLKGNRNVCGELQMLKTIVNQPPPLPDTSGGPEVMKLERRESIWRAGVRELYVKLRSTCG